MGEHLNVEKLTECLYERLLELRERELLAFLEFKGIDPDKVDPKSQDILWSTTEHNPTNRACLYQGVTVFRVWLDISKAPVFSVKSETYYRGDN